MNCPCQSGKTYNHCCRPWHDGKTAPTAEQLMRSRYSAYVLNNGAYLHRTWHSQTRPTKKSLMQLEATEWQGLQILRTEQGLETDNQGIVEFIASFQVQDQIQQMQETSRFLRENGRWVYVDALS